MPPATGKSKRTPRCAYEEGGRRCARSGTGNPPLCQPHRIVFSEAVRTGERRPGQGIFDLIDRYVSGKRINKRVYEGAIDDVAWFVAAAAEAGRATPQPPPSGDGGFRPPDGFRPPPGWRPHQPPPPDPAAEEQARRAAELGLARKRARVALGFEPGGKITLELVKKRRRELAAKHHPDRGGSVTKMQAINHAADVLEAELS